MGVDYYELLQVERYANNDDLEKAYENLALKWGHDKNPDNKEEADDMLKQISEAYQVLRVPEKRAIYDLSGARKRPSGAESDDTAFNKRSCKPSSFQENFTVQSRNQPASMESPLLCTLEELYKGAHKKRKVVRNFVDANVGHVISREEIFTIEVEPGWKNGTKVTFEGEVNEEQNIVSGDVVFIVEERPHQVFTRIGDDLIARLKVPLKEALLGYTAKVTTLDGRDLSIPIDDVIQPKYEKVVFGEGMPMTKSPCNRGNLIIKFDIIFPMVLSEKQKFGILKGFHS